MICVSIGTSDPGRRRALLRDVDMAEIRLDRMRLGPAEVDRLFASHPRLIATCRPGAMDEGGRRRLLLRAIESGAAYVDVELDADTGFRRAILARARAAGCRLIVSHHDPVRTPGAAVLRRLAGRCLDAGADLAKIATRVRTPRDAAVLLGLLGGRRPVVVAGMGRHGAIVRVAAPLLGSPFTYACASAEEATADGQLPLSDMRRILEILEHA